MEDQFDLGSSAVNTTGGLDGHCERHAQGRHANPSGNGN